MLAVLVERHDSAANANGFAGSKQSSIQISCQRHKEYRNMQAKVSLIQKKHVKIKGKFHQTVSDFLLKIKARFLSKPNDCFLFSVQKLTSLTELHFVLCL